MLPNVPSVNVIEQDVGVEKAFNAHSFARATETAAEPVTETHEALPHKQMADDIERQAPQRKVDASTSEALDLSSVTFYELFLVKAKAICGSGPRTTDDLVEALAVNKTQLNDWLKQAVKDGELTKLAKPVVRYEVSRARQATLALE
jgi:hypothetical protein